MAARLPAQDTSIHAFSSIDRMAEQYGPLRVKKLDCKAQLSAESVPDILRQHLETKINGLQSAMDQIEGKLVDKLQKKLEREGQGYKFERVTPVLALHVYELSTKLTEAQKLLTDEHRADLAKARALGGELHVADAPSMYPRGNFSPRWLQTTKNPENAMPVDEFERCHEP